MYVVASENGTYVTHIFFASSTPNLPEFLIKSTKVLFFVDIQYQFRNTHFSEISLLFGHIFWDILAMLSD